MSDFLQRRWVAALLQRSGLHALVERYHHEHEQHHAHPRWSWRAILHGSRLSLAYPALVALLAVVSAGTGLYPYGPVLVAAVVFAPERWRSTYLAACLGAATGATLLTLTVQSLGGQQLIAQYFPGLEQSTQWKLAQRWVEAYGSIALAVIAALPVPEIPPLLILALAKTPPPLIWLAIFCGKLFKYGTYIFLVRLILKAIRLGLRKAQAPE